MKNSYFMPMGKFANFMGDAAMNSVEGVARYERIIVVADDGIAYWQQYRDDPAASDKEIRNQSREFHTNPAYSDSYVYKGYIKRLREIRGE